jgi:PcRGLX-like protein central beta sandwich domain
MSNRLCSCGIMLVALFSSVACRATPAALKMPEVDPRARECGLYIEPRKEVAKARVVFTVTEPSKVNRKACPVRGSIPMYRGELKDVRSIRLLDAAGKPIPVQGLATGLWPERTVKFLCIDFVTNLKAGETKKFVLEYGTAVAPQTSATLKATAEDKTVTVDTGKMQVTFAPGKAFCSQVKVNGKAVTRGPVTGRALVSEGAPTKAPTKYDLIIKEAKLVEQGPAQVTVYLKGSYGTKKTVSTHVDQGNAPRYPFHAFVRLYADSARMDMTHSFGYNGSVYNDFVRAYGLTVPMNGVKTFVYGGDKGAKKETSLTGDLRLIQPGHSSWSLEGASQAKGKRIGGWAAVSGSNRALFGLRSAWQNWPVRFSATAKGDLTLDIYGGVKDTFLDLRYKESEDVELEWKKTKWGKEAPLHISKSMFTGDRLSTFYNGKPLAEATGLLKISEVVLDFSPDSDMVAVGNGHHQRLLPWSGAKRFADTRVLGLTGYYHDKDPRHQRAKDYYDILLDFPYAVHEANGIYGWVDWGDVPDVDKPKDGKTFDTSKFRGGQGWSNGERLAPAYFFHYAATGRQQTLDLGVDVILHNVGMDIEHYGGDQGTGGGHRHTTIHWGKPGGPRQNGWRGMYMAYWLLGHNEVWRNLQEFIPLPMGVARNSSIAGWPRHSGRSIKKWYIKPGAKEATVLTGSGTPFQYMNLMRWMTSGEEEFARWTEPRMQFYAGNYAPLKGKLTVGGGHPALGSYKVRTSDNSLIKSDKWRTLPPNDAKPPVPAYECYYYKGYGGSDMIMEWIQLTGSKAAIDALLIMGDYYGSESAGPKRVDIGTRKGPGRKYWQKYHARGEALAPVYALLRGKSHPERVARWKKGMEYRCFNPPDHYKVKMKPGTKPLDNPEDYNANTWAATRVRAYGKNGPKIIMAHAMPVVYTLWFSLPDEK